MNTTVSQALQLILNHPITLSQETISLADALDRVTAIDVLADRDYPPFDRATMDGFAIRSADFVDQDTVFAIRGTVLAGSHELWQPAPLDCIRIMTGAATPAGYDTIIRVEDCIVVDDTVRFAIERLRHGQNIARQGEDILNGKVIIAQNTQLSPVHIASLAVVGASEIAVYHQPRVAIISTGDEIRALGDTVAIHQIRDSNSYALASFLARYKIDTVHRALVPDDRKALSEAITDVLDYDILIVSGGVSMGAADYVPSIMAELGIRELLHKVQIRPGKPILYGQMPAGGVVFGLPGNPMSCQVCYKVFVEPYIRQCYNLRLSISLSLPLTEDKKKVAALDQYFPVQLTSEGVTCISFNGSGDVASSNYSDGIALHEMGRSDIAAGEMVRFVPW